MRPAKFLSLGVILFLTLPTASADESRPTLPKASYALPQTVKEWQKQPHSLTIIDVRDPREYDVGHIEGAINIPYLEVEKHAKEFKRRKHFYVFYCIYSAWRAPYAANTLADLGFRNVYILQGGISAWNAGGQVIFPNRPDGKISIAPYPPDLPKTLYHPRDRQYPRKVDLTVEELSRYDGKNGRAAYVAVDNVIYDVTQSRLWRGGVHDPSEGRAVAGRDLTEVFKHAPHGKDHLERFPVAGSLIK